MTTRARSSPCGGGCDRRRAARAAPRRPRRAVGPRRDRPRERRARARAHRQRGPQRRAGHRARPLQRLAPRQRRRAAALRPRAPAARAPPGARRRRALAVAAARRPGGRLARPRGRGRRDARRGPRRPAPMGGGARPLISSGMSDVQSGLEGVVAFATEIAEPDKEGGALRYRGVDIEDLVGQVPFEKVWGLLVDGEFDPGLPPAEPWPLTVRSGDPRVDVQSALAMLAPEWGFRPVIDISDEECRDNLARASVMALSFVAQSARGTGRPPVPQTAVDRANSIPERFLI